MLADGHPVVVLLSGGRDSVCLLDVAVAAGADVRALHVNYGLREADADADEALCVQLCAALVVPLTVHRPRTPRGNLQAWARAERYAAAAALPGDIAVGHTATDQVETVLYRLAASPGRRALLGMRPRQGRVIRPLLGWTREQTAAHCRARGLAWREDSSNEDPRFARNRARADLVPALRALHPAAEANVLRTLELLRDEDEVLHAAVDAARATPFADLPRALQRLVLQRLTEEACAKTRAYRGKSHTLSVARHAEAVARLARRGGSGSVDLGGGLRATIEYGTVRVHRSPRSPDAVPAPVSLTVPGHAPWGGGVVRAQRAPRGDLDAAALGDHLDVRAWRPGDRMRVRAHTRTLQNLFTDGKIPRARRAALPVVTTERGEIAWVPGVATGDAFRVTDATRHRVRLSWS